MNDLDEGLGLEHLVVERKLGEGVYGDVYLARRVDRDLRVAVKISRPPDDVDPAVMRRRFGREASVLARLSHPMLPRVYEVGDIDGQPYLVMEYLEGESLAEALQDGPLDEAAARRVGVSLASGLAAIHQHGIVHRDLKPENVIWDGRWARLVDFGLADRFESQEAEIVGTLAFSAPEQTGMLNRTVDRRADLYGLGCVLFKCLTGQTPFVESDPQRLMRAHVSQQPPDIAEIAPGVSQEFRDVVRRLLSKEPADRFPSAEDVIGRLEEIGTPVDAVPSPDTYRTWIDRQGDDSSEIATLRADWNDVRLNRTGRAVGIEGPRGAGTSMLMKRFVEGLDPEQGALLDLSGQSDNPAPLASLRRAARDVSETTLRQTGLLKEHDRLGTDDQGVGETRAADQWSQWIVKLARETGGVVLSIPNIDAIDEPTAAVLESLVAQIPSVPIMVVGTTHRPEAVNERMPGLHRLTRSSEHGRTIELEPLSQEDTARVIQSYLGGEAEDRQLIERLHNWSGGHHVAITEFLQLLLESLALRPHWGEWQIDWERLDAEALPGDLRALFEERLDDLSAEARTLCELGAVWGERFPVVEVGTIAGFEGRRPLIKALESAESADVLEATYLASGLEFGDLRAVSATFTHADYREVCLEELDDGRRAELHAQIGAHLAEQLGEDSDPEKGFRAAYHLARGPVEGQSADSFGICLRAGQWALSDGAYNEALRLLRHASEIAESYRLGRPAEFWFCLAQASVQTGHVDDARQAFQQAEVLADDPMQRARYRVVANGLLVGETRLDALESSSMELLEMFDATPPRSRFGLVVGILWLGVLLRWLRWWDRSEPTAEQPERQRLLVKVYGDLGIAATFQEQSLLAMYVDMARTVEAFRLGLSPERVAAQSSLATVLALAGEEDEAWRYVDRARSESERLDDPYAKARAELGRNWVAHIAGDPGEAADRQRTLLETRGGELPFHERSMAYEELLTNLLFRGHMREAVELFQEWEALRASDPHEVGAWGRIYGLVPIAEAFLGQRAEAQRCLQLGKQQAEALDSTFLRRTVLLGELVARLEWNESVGAPLDELIERFEELGADPDDTLFWFKSFYVFRGYVRVRQVEAARRNDLGRRPEEALRELRRSIRDLERAADDHPSFVAHAYVLRGYHSFYSGDVSAAGVMASEAEQLAAQTENRWVHFEVSRLRALGTDRQQDKNLPNWNARQALEIAIEEDWVHRAEELRQRFTTMTQSGSLSRQSGSFQTGSQAAKRSLDVERTLEALLSVSLATASSVDPDAVCREALQTSMEVFGAQRGLLFLSDDQTGTLTWKMGFDSEGRELSPDDTYSETVVRRVQSSRDPLVVTTSEQGEELGAESVLALGIRSIMAAPLILEDSLLGVIYLDNRMAHGVFTHDDVDVLRAIASHVPVAIETARKARLEVEVESERSRRQFAERLRSYIERINGLMDPAQIAEELVTELESIEWASRITALTVLRTPPTVVGWQRGKGRFGRPELEDDLADGERWWEASEVWKAVADGREVRLGSTGRESVWSGDFLLDCEECHWVGIPLGADADVRGIVVLEGRDDTPMDTDTLEQVLAFTSQTGVALESTWLATVDALTGVLNRGAFVDRADEIFGRAVRKRQPLTVFVADLDHFKEINDTYGHGVGDEVLQEVAQICNDTVRLNDLFGRHGGEEFVGVLPNTPEEQGRKVAERLRKAVAEHDFEAVDDLRVTISLGVAGRRPSDETFDDVFDHADGALYAAKEAGRNCVTTPD